MCQAVFSRGQRPSKLSAFEKRRRPSGRGGTWPLPKREQNAPRELKWRYGGATGISGATRDDALSLQRAWGGTIVGDGGVLCWGSLRSLQPTGCLREGEEATRGCGPVQLPGSLCASTKIVWAGASSESVGAGLVPARCGVGGVWPPRVGAGLVPARYGGRRACLPMVGGRVYAADGRGGPCARPRSGRERVPPEFVRVGLGVCVGVRFAHPNLRVAECGRLWRGLGRGEGQ